MPTDSNTDAAAKPLTTKEQRFVDEYLVCLEPRQAALKAGYAPSVARSNAYGWACDSKSKPHVFAAIEAGKKARSGELRIEAADVLRHLWEIAIADPNELVQHRRVACRHCHGIDHAYQWVDDHELAAATAEALDEGRDIATLVSQPKFSGVGGFGYDHSADPNSSCRYCRGEGIGVMHLVDTRTLSRPVRRLLAGVSRTKEGTNVKMHDQMKALEMVARHLGMFNDAVTVKGDADNPLAILVQQLQGTAIKPGPQAGKQVTE